MTQKIGNGSIPLRIGNIIDTEVYGGPYRQRPQGFFYVKMAAEIMDYWDVSIPTEDFDVPAEGDMHIGLMRTFMHMLSSNDPVYVGCAGGIGRTGLFLALLAKTQIEFRRIKHRKGRGADPVEYVREHYIPHAVETQQQREYVDTFNVRGIAEWLDHTQELLGMNQGFKRTVPYTVTETLPEDRVIATFDTPGVTDEDTIGILTDDSASEAQEGTIEDEQWADLYETIDELEDRVTRAENLALAATEHSIMVRKLLTKQSIFERIRSLFR